METVNPDSSLASQPIQNISVRDPVLGGKGETPEIGFDFCMCMHKHLHTYNHVYSTHTHITHTHAQTGSSIFDKVFLSK